MLALGLAGWDWGTDDLVLHMLAIGIPATMAAAVMLDLLARPGSLARGEHAGLVIAPQPLRAIGTRIEVFRRYRELLRIARQEGFGPFISAGVRAEHATEATGARLRRVLEQAGGVYIKLGQIAATRVDLLPPEICAELAELQNRVAARADRADQAGDRGGDRRRGRDGVRRVRLGAAGRGVDQPDLSRAAALR